VSWILLSNDDGVASPALRPLARALTPLGEVRVVVPEVERSWIGKAITRFEPLHVRKVADDPVGIWACSGYPADAVQLGIHALFDEPPRLVVSGINIGYNYGAAFLMSSGTVGAAVEAWVSGIPGVAVSTGQVGDWEAWRAAVLRPDAAPGWEALGEYTAELLGAIGAGGLFDRCDVVSINVPWGADASTPVRITSVARTGYERLFRKVDEGVFVHDFGALVPFDGLAGTDVGAARERIVSVTPLRMPEAVDVPVEIRRRVER